MDVTVVVVETGQLLPHHIVLVRDDQISWVGPATEASIRPGTTRIDGGNQFLAPGLADMHVHLDPEALGLYLANGITTIRDLNGDTMRLRLREEIASGRRPGPTLVVAGPLLAGEPQRWRHRLIETAEEGREEVIRESRLGFTMVKVYDGLSREAYQSILSTAESLTLPVTGHIPRAVGLKDVLRYRQNIEHAASILDATIGHSLDTVALDSALDEIAEAGVWVTPTLAAFEALTLLGDSAVWARFDGEELRYVEPDIRAWWLSLRRGPTASGVSARARARWLMLQRVVRGLAVRGVPLMAGTDDPNPLMVPGFALHEELRVLEQAGVPRRDVLAMATVNPATFLGVRGNLGAIRKGARADLVLLSRNPLEDLSAFRKPTGVMAQGHWFPAATLASMVAAVARKYR